MDTVMTFLADVPRTTWVVVVLMFWLPVAVHALMTRITAMQIRRTLEEADRNALADPANRPTQSPMARPRIIRGSFKRVGSVSASSISSGMDGGAAA